MLRAKNFSLTQIVISISIFAFLYRFHLALVEKSCMMTLKMAIQ